MFTSCKKDPNTDDNAKKALLIILDGWGIGDQSQSDVIAQTTTPYMDYLKATYPHSQLQASGTYVGLPEGQMGNSETGHLNIGAGRVVYQDLVKINLACADNSILENPEIQSAFEVKDKLVEALKTDKYDWIVVNFANADMVGHTGVYTAIGTAVQTIDQCLNEVVETAKTMGYETIITADHGNADHAINADGTPNTAHSTNPVPFIYVTENSNATVQNGALADVAPTILHIMGLQQPKEMTGQCLIME